MTAKSDIEAIKNDADLSDAERIWQALDKLAEHVDNAPAATMKRIKDEAWRASASS
jgi:hypothetical protein